MEFGSFKKETIFNTLKLKLFSVIHLAVKKCVRASKRAIKKSQPRMNQFLNEEKDLPKITNPKRLKIALLKTLVDDLLKVVSKGYEHDDQGAGN